MVQYLKHSRDSTRIREKRVKISLYAEELIQLHEFVKMKGMSLSAFVNKLIKEDNEYSQWRKEHNYEQFQ